MHASLKKILFADATETCVRSSEFRGCENSKRVTHPSFYDACVALESATQSTICDDSLAEVCSYNMPRQVRQCFGIMTAFGAIAETARLREKYKRHMLDRNAKKRAEELERLSLQHIQRILNAAGQDIRAYEIAYSENGNQEKNVAKSEHISQQQHSEKLMNYTET